MENGPKFLSELFIHEVTKEHPRNEGQLKAITYKRTYSRWLEDKQRRETWAETCERAVNYNVGLYQGPASREDLIREAELFFRKMYHHEVFPSGRSMFIGGTKAVELHPTSAFNCSYLSIKELEDFCEIFALLLCGCGVGFGVRQEDISLLPSLNPNITTTHDKYSTVYPHTKRDETFSYDTLAPGLVAIEIGDSKDGWVNALRYYLQAHQRFDVKEIRLNYDLIRPARERLKTFGGRAAGHGGLEEMFKKLSRIIGDTGGRIDSVRAMDIANIIAANVVVGGTRRSAQIAFGSPADVDFIDAKLNIYPDKKKNPDGTWNFGPPHPDLDHRQMSNNSVCYEDRPNREDVHRIFANIKVNGDPGFFNLAAARKRRVGVVAGNPCMEILLDDSGVCNLSTVIISSHIKNGVLDHSSLQESFRLAARIGMRQTNVTLPMEHWDKVQKRDRLIGVSMTGYMDALDTLGVKYDDQEVVGWLRTWRWAANNEADKYSFEMRIPRPLLVTCVKPEGTASLLPTVSCGMHRGYAPHFLRRISVAANDPLAQALVEMGVPYEGDATKVKSGRIKVVIPVKTNAKMAAADEPARDQFNRYLLFQKHYTDHNTSCTITVGPDEWDEIADLVYENWDDVVACAFLSKIEDSHPQLPYQRVSEEVYNEYLAKMPDLTLLDDIVNKYELTEFLDGDLDYDVACATGSCPVR